MPAANYDIVAEEGASFVLRMLYKDDNNQVINLAETIDVDGEMLPKYAGRLQIRAQIQDDGTLIEVPAQNLCDNADWLPPNVVGHPGCTASPDDDSHIELTDGSNNEYNIEIKIGSITMTQGNGTVCCAEGVDENGEVVELIPPGCGYGTANLLAGRHFYDFELVERSEDWGANGDGNAEDWLDDPPYGCIGPNEEPPFTYPCQNYPGGCTPLHDPEPESVSRLLQGRFVIVPNVTRAGV